MKFWPMETLPNHGFVSFKIFNLGAAQINETKIYVAWGDPIAIVYVTVTVVCLSIILVLLVLSVVLSGTNHLAFQRSSPPFLYLVCLGSFLGLLPVFFVGGNQPTDTSCNVALWLFALGLNISYSAVVVKAGRLWYILRKAHGRQNPLVKLPNKQLLLYLAIQVLTLLVCMPSSSFLILTPTRCRSCSP